MDNTSFEPAHDLFNAWLDTYEATLGRIVEVPALGPSREKYDKMMTGFSKFVNFYTTWMEVNSDFQKVFADAMNRVNERVAAETGEGISPDKYKDFYNIWIETYSSSFKDFLKSGRFASDMGRFMSYFMEFQKYNREMLEENYLKQVNLPTKSDIDEINKELYSLRKKTKELARQIQELSGKGQPTS